MPAVSGKSVPELFQRAVIDIISPLETKWQVSYKAVCALIGDAGVGVDAAASSIVSKASKSTDDHDSMVRGLVYIILSSDTESSAQRAYSLVQQCARDGAVIVGEFVAHLCAHPGKFLPNVQKQLLWLTGRLIDDDVSTSDIAMLSILRSIQGGNLSVDNIQLCSSALELIEKNWAWVQGQIR